VSGLTPAALLCDADGNLFPSEEPAFAASADVINRMLKDLGSVERHEAEALRRAAAGKTFRATASELAAAAGHPLAPGDLEGWVDEEKRAVSAHLAQTLSPDPEVVDVLTRLGAQMTLAAVSSSALSRLDACFRVTGLADLLPPERRFSAEDSLPRPTSKPDPAVYLHAVEQLEIASEQGLAIEDSLPGARSAIAAGIPTVGNLRFVAADERAARAAQLRDAGVLAVVASWREVEELIASVVA
jgi:beta-phosphoglucomutase-like phosphatase (HAD superfamily)